MKKEEFIKKAKKMYQNKISFDRVKNEDINPGNRVTIVCNRCGMVFRRTPENLLKGICCPICDEVKTYPNGKE